MSDTKACWRDVSLDFVEVGRCLEEIEQCIRSIRATKAISDDAAKMQLYLAYKATTKLSRALNALRYTVGGPE